VLLWQTIIHGPGFEVVDGQVARRAVYARADRDVRLRLAASASHGFEAPENPLRMLLEAGSDATGWRGLVDFGALGSDPRVADVTLRPGDGLRVVWAFEATDSRHWWPRLLLV
jgi:hypothetical protein